MVDDKLSTKDSIRLGQAMNIVGNKYAIQHGSKEFYEWNNESFRHEVLSLYDAFEEIEADLIAEKKEYEELNKKPMGFPTTVMK